MNSNAILKRLGAVGFAFSGFWLAAVPLARPAAAQTSEVNCPQIFYREPFTNRVSAPAGCPPTEYQKLRQNSEADDLGDSDQPNTAEELRTPSPASTTVPPRPEDRSQAIATVSLRNNQLTVSLNNNTGATVVYEVVGNTPSRMLMADESIMLQGIPLPATITVTRQDEGLLDVAAESTQAGMLEISLTPEPALDDTQGVIRIREDGQVFTN